MVMKDIAHSTTKGAIFSVALLLFTATFPLHGQEIIYSYYYRVYLKDKGENSLADFTLPELLSSKAIFRRNRSGITVPDISDLPVSSIYINKIKSTGFVLHCTSKWMNTALFKTRAKVDIKILLDQPFVSDVKIVKVPDKKEKYNNKLDFTSELTGPPPFDRPVTMVNGHSLHNSGFDGKNILIATLDGGFLNADHISQLTNSGAGKGSGCNKLLS
jgi:serine protease AprX